MNPALLAISLLAACLGFGPTAFSQPPDKDRQAGGDMGSARQTLTWQQLARHSGLVELKARSQAELKVDALFARPGELAWLRAEIALNAAEWAQFTKSGTKIGLFAYWFHGKMGHPWRELVAYSPFPAGTVDVSNIPEENAHVGLSNDEAGESRLYVLVPGPAGSTGSLFYFYRQQKSTPPPAAADGKPQPGDPFAH